MFRQQGARALIAIGLALPSAAARCLLFGASNDLDGRGFPPPGRAAAAPGQSWRVTEWRAPLERVPQPF
jgi:hypothetical protein